MKMNYKLLVRSLIASSILALVAGCNHGGGEQNLEVQQHIMAHQGLDKGLLTQEQDKNINFKDIAYGNKIYMIVGTNGVFYTSPDAMAWTERVIDVKGLNLSGVAYNSTNNTFYAVGDKGMFLSSKDGVSWTEYVELNKTVNLHSIDVLPDGNVIIGGDGGSIFEINLARKGRISVREMQSKDGNENSIVAAVTHSPEYMVAASSLSSLDGKENDDFSSEDWVYSGSNDGSFVNDVVYNSKSDTFMALSKKGSINTTDATKYGSVWSQPASIGYPDAASYKADITANSIASDSINGYIFVAGGGGDNKNTFIRYTKNVASWANESMLYPANTGSLNKVRCFTGSQSPMCIAVGDKKAIVIIKIKNDEVTPEPIDINDPKIISFDPVNESTNVNTTPVMQLVFNKHVVNVDNSNVVLYKDSIGSDEEVKINNFVHEPNDFTHYTFNPAHKLRDHTHYQVLVKSGIQDKYGKSIESELFNFTTGDVSYPEVKSVTPYSEEAAVNNSITMNVVFSEPVLNVNTTNVTLHEGSDTGSVVEITDPTTNDTIDYLFSGKSKLKAMTKYCMVFGSGITDIYENKLKPYSSCFTTGDFEAPTVNMIKPQDGETNVSQTTRLEFKFGKAVTGVSTSSVILHEGSATGVTVNLSSITLQNDTYSAVLSAPLKLSTNYFLTFSSDIKDALSKNPLPQTTFSFKTRADAIVAVMAGDECIYSYSLTGKFTCAKKLIYGMNKILYVASEKKLLVIGEAGKGYSSTDGMNWYDLQYKTSSDLNAIASRNATGLDIVAVGDKGAIVVSHDLGKTWAVKPSPSGTKNLTNIRSDGSRFWIAVDGADWLVSSDGGDTWAKDESIGKLPVGIQTIFSANETTQIVGGNKGVIYTSGDDMKTWTPQPSVLNGGIPFNSYIHMKELGKNILLGNNNSVYISDNSGMINDKWEKITVDVSTIKENFLSDDVNSDGDVYMVSDTGNLYMSTDGAHWIKLGHTPVDDNVTDVTTID